MAKRRRPELETREDLIDFLQSNTDTELPFNPEAWGRAFKATEGKERQFSEKIITDFEGNTKTKIIPNGSISPVGKYFQLMALPQYARPYNGGLDDIEDDEDEPTNEAESSLGDETKSEVVANWINVFFVGYEASDKRFLRERLSDYYDNYELNEGADKMLVIKTVADELEIMKLTKQRGRKGVDVETKLEKIQKGYLSLLDSLKALKKQRGAGDDEGKNKLTKWVDELEKAGEFKPYKENTYESDDIDRLLLSFEVSMVRVFNEG